MPMIDYTCPCGHNVTRLVKSKELTTLENSVVCPKCNNNSLKRQLGAPASSSKMIIDNGASSRAVEINPHVIVDNIERSKKIPDRG